MNESQETKRIGAMQSFVRSREGLIAGVCEGLGRRFGIEPWLLRLAWLFSVMFFGTGLVLYFILALTLPREDQLELANQKKFLGVCQRISASTGLDIGLVRAATVLLGILSFGATIVGYIVLHFVLSGNDASSYHTTIVQ